MDLLNVVIRADTGGSDRAAHSLDGMAASGRQADVAVRNVGESSTKTSGQIAQTVVHIDQATVSSKAFTASAIAQARAAEALAASAADGQAMWNSFSGVSGAASKAAKESAAVFEAEMSRLDGIARMRAAETGAAFADELNLRLVSGTGKSARDAAAVFEAELSRIENTARLVAQEAGAAFNQDLNSRFGIGKVTTSARESAEVFELAAREAEGYARKVSAIRAQIDPAAAAQERYNAEMAEFNLLLRNGDLSLQQFSQAQQLAANRMNGLAQSNKSGSGAGSFQVGNLAAQGQDIAVTAAMGMNAGMIGLQQGTQIAAVVTTLEKPMQAIAAAVASILSPLSLLVIGVVTLVAAGIQIVDWGWTAETALNAVADALVPVAPYAAAAAIGLALLYAPAILSGLLAAVGSLGTVATAVWGVATAIYATVGLPVLLVAGFAAMATAAVIWRDDLEKMLGFDIVGAAQTGINAVIGFFVGGFNAIGAVWGNLGAVFQEIMWNVGQEIARGFENIVKNAAGSINDLIGLVPEQLRMGIAPIDVGAIKFTSPEANPNAGASANVGKLISDAMGDAQGVDYVGGAISFVQDAASGAADALRGLADGMNVNEKASKAAAKETERQAEAYRDLTRDARQFIADQELATSSLGMTEEATNRLRYEQEMLNKAANDNISLSPAQRDELGMLAGAMAAAEAATKRAKDAFDFAKGAVHGFLTDMRQGLMNGEGFWQSFGNAAMGVLDKIIDKVEGQLVDALFSLGGMSNAGGGGFNIFSAIGSLFGFSNGGYTGSRATDQIAGVVHGGEYVFSASATSRIGVANLEAMHSSARGYAGGGYVAAAPDMGRSANQNGLTRIAVDVGVSVDDEGKIQAYVKSISRQEAQSAAAAGTQVAIAQSAKQTPSVMAKYQQQRSGSDYRT